jgi:7-keto-8-aminopelargonate synthetase-like enzyme
LHGFAVRSSTPLLPLVLGDHAVAVQVARTLLGAGVLAVPLGPPVTPADAARIRFVITAAHTEDDLTTAAEALDNAITTRNRVTL